LVLCGDPKQAIYGFAGADCNSMARMEKELSVTERGCIHLPLTVTRRCGKAIVAEAKKIVPDFEAFETNPEGKIGYASIKGCQPGSGGIEGSGWGYRHAVTDGDMILCRCNASLVSECFAFLRQGRKATIQGRDVGQGLIGTIKKSLQIKGSEDEVRRQLAVKTVVELVAALDDWLHLERAKEEAKRNPSENRLVSLGDRHDCLVCFCEGAVTAADVVGKITAIFTDDKSGGGIKLSSVHKAKGLEARRVFILVPKEAPMPHPLAKSHWEKEQELNLKYVAITRAIEELIWVN
jgi:superfamily I DNA/RNA helicase